jgi:Clp amino terminal domain, pathogenicity island component
MASPFSLEELVEYALARLAEATTVAEQVTELADDLVGHFVDEARGTGASWNQIGQSLGVTKQAAQKRFVGPAADPEPWPRPAWMSDETAAVIQQAQREARALGCQYIDVDHLVVAALRDPTNRAHAAVRGLGVAPAEVTAALVAAIPRGPGSGTGTLMFTAQAKQSLAPGPARRHRHEQVGVGPEHLLLNVLAGRKGGRAQRTLTEFGVTERAVKTWLASH